MTVSQEDVDEWVRVIGQLHDSATTDLGDARAAAEATANLWSGFGYQNAPPAVLEMFVRAIEIGYATALHDVRTGDFDEDISTWRPDLTSQ